jgi:ParB/RepB/Spo0J family partition protein
MAKKGKVEIENVAINKIKINRNSRGSISKDDLHGLMQSISELGLLQPIGVVRAGSGFEICYGNRRFLACSKLGMTKIPVIIHDDNTAADVDMKNLAENIQRRNISLPEAGRYIEGLNKEGLSLREIAVRLGVSAGYVENCRTAYNRVPEEFKQDLEVQVTNEKISPGKIAIKTANAILSAEKTFRLSAPQVKTLFKAAKSDARFSATNLPKYAAALKKGKADPIAAVKPVRHVRVNILLDESEYDALVAKHITGGPFNSMTQLVSAILRGEKSVKINVLGNF